MEKINLNKFEKLSKEQMQVIAGGAKFFGWETTQTINTAADALDRCGTACVSTYYVAWIGVKKETVDACDHAKGDSTPNPYIVG